MIETLLNLVPGGTLGAIVGAVGFVLAVLGVIVRKVYKAGQDNQIAKGAKEDAKVIKRIRDAADARPTDSLSNDPNNRDNR